jgi:hypothetical protein
VLVLSEQIDDTITMVANDAQASVREIAPYEHAAPYQGDNGANEKQPGVSSVVVS